VSASIAAPETAQPSSAEIKEAAALLKSSGQGALFLGGRALRETALFHAGRIAAATGARLICETLPARLQRGAGRVEVERLPYFAEMATELLSGIEQMVFIGSKPPVAFFAYPGKPSWLSPESASLFEFDHSNIDAEGALRCLADELVAPASPKLVKHRPPPAFEKGKLTRQSAGIITAALMPQNAIVSDEAGTNGMPFYNHASTAPKHDWLVITGGSIGQGLPLATGAAVACPDRKVIALQADGSGMYTLQALWTMARENLDVTIIIMKNNSYGILNIELGRVGVEDPSNKALSLLDLTNPTLDWVSLSTGMGVPASSATTTDEFSSALKDAISSPGPRLVEAVLV
jgi:acetolactate synthase-1/2/3 large subunit